MPARFVSLSGLGEDFQSFEVDRRWIFRFPIRPEGEEQIAREWVALPELAPRLSLPVPQYEFLWEPTRRYPHRFGGYRKIEGTPLFDMSISVAGRRRAGAELARFLSELHRFPLRRVEGLEIPVTSLRQCVQARVDWSVRIFESALFPYLSERRIRSVVAMGELLERDLTVDAPPSLLHGDLGLEHVLADQKTEAITGVIDWGDLMVGDPAAEVPVIAGAPEIGVAFAREYRPPYDDGFSRRVDLWWRLWWMRHIAARLRRTAEFRRKRVLETMWGRLKRPPAREYMPSRANSARPSQPRDA